MKIAAAALQLLPIGNLAISEETFSSVEACGVNLRQTLPDVQKDIDEAQKRRGELKRTRWPPVALMRPRMNEASRWLSSCVTVSRAATA